MALPRELIKWIQSLDLTWSVKTPKWDVSNGYLVAEIFSWYFPQDVEMCMYHNTSALDLKVCNWHLLKKVMKMKKHKIDIPNDVLDGTIHCKDGAAFILLQILYEILTNRQLKVIPPDPEIDFTDRGYQSKLPIHARSTAIQAIRNNLRFTELMTNQNIITNQQKAQTIVERHTQDRQEQRMINPDRFDRKATLGELALRQPPPQQQYNFEYGSEKALSPVATQVDFEESGDSVRSNSDRRSNSIKTDITGDSSSGTIIGSFFSERHFNQSYQPPAQPAASCLTSAAAALSPSSLTAGCHCQEKILCECCN